MLLYWFLSSLIVRVGNAAIANAGSYDNSTVRFSQLDLNVNTHELLPGDLLHPDSDVFVEVVDSQHDEQHEHYKVLMNRDLAEIDALHEITDKSVRQMSEMSASIGDFHPLACNSNLENAPCNVAVSSNMPTGSNPLVIRCGECYIFDLPSNEVNFPGGINIKGKLKFPDNRKITIRTTFVIVQGELEIRSTHNSINADNESVVFNITGTNDIKFNPTDSPNENACSQQPNGECNLGPKPFFIAGGKLDIDAFPNNCKTHTQLIKKVLQKPTKNPNDFPQFEELPSACGVSGTNFMRYTFSDGNLNGWTGWYSSGSAVASVDGSALKVSNRASVNDGPTINIMPMNPHLCLEPLKDYVFDVSIKLERSGSYGLDTYCKTGSPDNDAWWWNCPRLTSRTKSDTRHKHRTLIHMQPRDAPKYGEWVAFTGTIQFQEDDLLGDVTTFILQIDRPEAGTDIFIDNLRLGLPKETSFPDPNDVCRELIMNGDAEGNGINPYPMKKSRSDSSLSVIKDGDNKYFHLTNRPNKYASITAELDDRCFDAGVTYKTSVKIRLHSEFDEKFNFYIRALDSDGNWFHQRVLDCPVQKFVPDFVTCSGKFTISHRLAGATQASFRMEFAGERDKTFDIDYDEIHINYYRGFLNKVVVSTLDSHCWGQGSDIHIGSSSYYSYHPHLVANGFTSSIKNVLNKNDGTTELELESPPDIPVLSYEEDIDRCADVALISRNIKIGGDVEEEDKGAYLQVLHTLNVPQKISGVQFKNMGRRGEVDKFGLQILYSGSIEGTDISMNSFYKCNQRCITINGSGNITILGNVGVSNYGHCIHSGPSSRHNIISDNFVSDTRSIPWTIALSGSRDSHAAGFYNHNGPNDYTNNIAVGSHYYGFYFYNDWRFQFENGTYYSQSSSPRDVEMGQFVRNNAKSNGHTGMHFHSHLQLATIVFEALKSLKNRYFGFYMSYSQRAIVKNCVFSDNAYGIEMRYSDEVEIQNTDIIGLTDETKDLVNMPYFNKPCITSNFHSPIGYRMQTQIYRFDKKLSDDTYLQNIGAKFTDVKFSKYDHDDECFESVAIGFNVDTTRDGHWNYVSSFNSVQFTELSNMIDAKSANEGGVSDIVITDVGGFSDPLGQATVTSSFVSNRPHLIDLARGDCKGYNAGFAYCVNTCYRTVTLYIEQTDSAEFDLKVIRVEDGVQTYGDAFYRFDDDLHRKSFEGNNRKYSVALPWGTYRLEFYNGLDPIWPKHVYEVYEGKPDCTSHGNGPDVVVLEPEIEDMSLCDSLIVNSDMHLGQKYWQHRNSHSSTERGYLQELPGGGKFGSNAIGYYNRTSFYDGIGQSLDTRCFHQNVDAYYEIKVWFRTTNATVLHLCDRFNDDDRLVMCPEVTLKSVKYEDPLTKEELDWKYSHYAYTVLPNDSQEFSLVHGVFQVKDGLELAQRAWIYIEYADSSLDLVVDDFTVIKLENVCGDDEFVRNGDFESGYSMFWTPSDSKFKIVNFEGSKAIEIYNKATPSSGILQYFYVNQSCMKEKDRYHVSVKFKLKNAQGSDITCDRIMNDGVGACSRMRLYTYSPIGGRSVYIDTVASDSGENDGWSVIAGIYTISEREATFSRMYLKLLSTHPDNVVIYDNVSMKRIPKSCKQMIENPSFEDGTSSFWQTYNREMDYSIVSDGASSTEFAIRLNSGTGKNYYYLWQDLDTRCFIEGQQFDIAANFKIVNSTDPNSVLTCDPSNQNLGSDDHCPYVYIYGSDCDGANLQANLFSQSQQPWSAGNYNEFQFEFTVDANLASCDHIRLGIGRYTPLGTSLLFDEVRFGQKTTFSPTVSPTYQPTKKETIGPTVKPTIRTDAPTTTIFQSCPPAGSAPLKINAGSIMLERVANIEVCTVTKVQVTGGKVMKSAPVARSYHSYDWEVSPGEFASSNFADQLLCYSSGCQIDLPTLGPGEEYHLTRYSTIQSKREKLARFLETATFGVTSEDLDNLEFSGLNSFDAITSWIQSQMNEAITKITSHREYWREKVNPRAPAVSQTGIPDHPCSVNSRWRRFSFVRNDVLWFMKKELTIKGTGPYTLFLDGNFRTVVNDFWIGKENGYQFDPNFKYEICRYPDEKVNGNMGIKIEDGSCVYAENPRVDLTGQEGSAQFILNLSQSNLQVIDEYLTNGEEFMLRNAISNTLCEAIPAVPDLDDEPIFARVSDGTWLQFDPRLIIETNSVNSPIADGGKATKLAGGSYCSNVPRTFMNEDHCQVSSNGCETSSKSNELEVLLDNKTISELNILTGRYVYIVKGLNVVDQSDDGQFPWKLPHPCTEGLRSRWIPKDLNDCNPTDIYSGTNSSLHELISSSRDSNPFMRDIHFPTSGMSCNETDTNPDIEIAVNDECWRRVHEDFLSVWDMTYWVGKHPGLSDPITKWADNNGTTLIFPNSNPDRPHTMDRWHNNYHKFTYIGRFGDRMMIRDLPNELRTEKVTSYYDPDVGDENKVLVCGSPGEISNKRSDGFTFDISSDFQSGPYDVGANRKNVWYMVTLTAQDQLRQRVAWALSQILVVVASAIGEAGRYSEWFFTYYDIFLRNAFGNYRNILREISYSPLMAENLSFLQSKSSAYVFERYKTKAQADENFAREIMQLFSMGIVKLNMDGSPKVNAEGNTELAYTNDDIMSLSRCWTGFDLQPRRGNVEGRNNRVDPMRIEPSWRDRFPKTDTTGGYIGDHYPLCEDLPKRAFLKKGAVYRFLGSSPLPELISDPSEFVSLDPIERVVLNPSSALKSKLCNFNNGKCNYKNKVILDSNLSCDGIECDLEAIRVVQVGASAFYEYVRLPCVNQVFYNGGVKISPRYRWDPVMCANPELPDATEACCEQLSNFYAERNSLYDGERMRLTTAHERCNNISKKICDFNRVQGNRHKNSMYFWTSDDCNLRVKINSSGMVTVVHKPTDSTNVVSHVEEKNENYFKVYWKSNAYPKAPNCGVCEILDDACMCSIQVAKRRAFEKAPADIKMISEKLFIGALDPNVFRANSFTQSFDSDTGITTYLKEGKYDIDTVFAYTDDKGRHHFMKNLEETVLVRGIPDGNTGYSFRNAPQFMSFVPSETTRRDAEQETEAALDHYFYHDNTAPFLAMRLIQRLVSSNPSPRYISTVATAFKTGSYIASNGQVFGTSEYGDLSAMFAAIYLDRESRSFALDADPSQGILREPILKVMSLLRSMDFRSKYPVIYLKNVKRGTGQNPHSFDSVFSFFLPEFKPYGRVGDASLVAPEATLLDMPRIVGTMNGLHSLVKYGLSSCSGGFGWMGCREAEYKSSSLGELEYARIDQNSQFSQDTFEGPSLTGGFDNPWIGRRFGSWKSFGAVVPDPISPDNHVFHPNYNSQARFFSPPVNNVNAMVVKFQYFGTKYQAGGCIGYVDKAIDQNALNYQKWIFCDAPVSYADHTMSSISSYISCQFEIPSDITEFRIVVGDRTSSGEAYFDNIYVTTGTGTTCDGVGTDKLTPSGELGFSTKLVDDLATLLTAGRLSLEHRSLIRNAYDNAGSANDGLKIAQLLILSSSEFHTTNFVKPTNQAREDTTFPLPTGKPYRAVVYMMFSGGCDSFNMLVPHTCSNRKDMYKEYLEVRQQVAISKEDLLPISVHNQICETFGIHPDLKAIRDLYSDNDLLFFANAGVLTEPVNKENWNILTTTQLFAHNMMQQETKRVDPHDLYSGTGILGRMADVLSESGHNTGSFSVDSFSVALVGSPVYTGSPMIVNRNGVPDMYLDDTKELLSDLHKATTYDSGYFAETWSSELINSININDLLGSELDKVTLDTEFPNTNLARQLKTVAKLMGTRSARGVDVDTFYVEVGGFDTHDKVEERLSNRFIEVNDAIEAFTTEIKNLGLWDNVVTIQTSDFARTLNPNSGDGTDHAWGGNYMMFGGSVKGKKILGDYPDNLTSEGPLSLGRGRMIPTTPWDGIFMGIARWAGVREAQITRVLPNLSNFPSLSFGVSDMFEDVAPPAPTTSPTDTPMTMSPTPSPTIGPTKAPVGTGSPTETPTKTPTGDDVPTSTPTLLPTYTPICFDDTTFRFNNKENRACDWVKRKAKFRCIRPHNGGIVFEFCRKSCKRCACANENWLYRNLPRRNCDWVARKPLKRCTRKGAKEHCKKACADYGAKPCCQDHPTYHQLNNPKRTCAWAKVKPTKRCAIARNRDKKFPYKCPETCGYCSGLC